MLVRAGWLVFRGWWEGVARQYRLRRLPPVATTVAVLLVGVAVPLALQADARPAEVTRSLAMERLGRFARVHEGTQYTFGPAGDIYSPRPAFQWEPVANAARYVLTVQGPSGSETYEGPAAHYLMPAPGLLEPGSYRFVVEAMDATGATLAKREGSFRLLATPRELARIRRRSGLDLARADAALVEMGYFAKCDSPHDVFSALVAFAEPLGSDSRDALLEDWRAGRLQVVLGHRVTANLDG